MSENKILHFLHFFSSPNCPKCHTSQNIWYKKTRSKQSLITNYQSFAWVELQLQNPQVRVSPSKGRTWSYSYLLPSSTLFGTYKYIQVINSNPPYFSDNVRMFLLSCLIGLGPYCCRKQTTNISLSRLRDFWKCRRLHGFSDQNTWYNTMVFTANMLVQISLFSNRSAHFKINSTLATDYIVQVIRLFHEF